MTQTTTARARSRLRPVGNPREPGEGRGAAETEPVDGRAARSQRTRVAIVDALRALNRDGHLAPTVAQVAEQAGISRRTVWQHFADLEALLAEAGRRDLEIAMSLSDPVDPDQPLAARIEQLTAQRARIMEAMAPSWRASRLQEPFSAQLRTNKQRMVAIARAELERTFAPELRTLRGRERARLADAAHVATLWATWESLRTEVGCTVREARAVTAATLTSLFAAAASPGSGPDV
ncbi:MAG: TetR/AcrR family transcriptional regulator [Jatrophihabitantaceae bacterium]